MTDYGNLIGFQCPGSLGDTSKYNIDGRCFAADDHASVMVGKIVNVKSIVDGYKEITDVFNKSTLAYGVTYRSHMNTSVDDEGYMVYMPGDPVSIITHGRAWVMTQTVNSKPEFGQPIRVGADGFLVATGGWEVGGWHYTGGWQKWNGLFYIAEIQLIQNAPSLLIMKLSG